MSWSNLCKVLIKRFMISIFSHSCFKLWALNFWQVQALFISLVALIICNEFINCLDLFGGSLSSVGTSRAKDPGLLVVFRGNKLNADKILSCFNEFVTAGSTFLRHLNNLFLSTHNCSWTLVLNYMVQGISSRKVRTLLNVHEHVISQFYHPLRKI